MSEDQIARLIAETAPDVLEYNGTEDGPVSNLPPEIEAKAREAAANCFNMGSAGKGFEIVSLSLGFSDDQLALRNGGRAIVGTDDFPYPSACAVKIVNGIVGDAGGTYADARNILDSERPEGTPRVPDVRDSRLDANESRTR